jgi:MFS superfamily sulfate permease-like transporter
LLLAAIAIPEQLATARLAGLPPEVGLVAFAAGAIGFAIFGTNRFLSLGADSTIAPIFAGGLAAMAVAAPLYAELAALLALMVGLILVVAALIRAGWIADLLSIPVTTGFLVGIAVHIAVGQLPVVFGVPPPSGGLLLRLVTLLQGISSANPYALGIGAFVVALTLSGERFAPRFPAALLAIGLAALAVAAFGLRDHHVEVLAALPATLPHPSLPSASLDDIVGLAPLALIVALVCMMQTGVVLRAFPADQPERISRDFGGIGAGCILAGLFGAFPVNASPPRTAVVAEAGGRSQLASLIAVALAALLVLYGGTLLGLVPQAALGGVLLAIAVRIAQPREMARILRYGSPEFPLVVAAAALVIVLPIETGMLAAIVLSLVQSFYNVARPHCAELERAPGTTVWWPPQGEAAGERVPGVLVFAPSAPLNFTNVTFIHHQLQRIIAQSHIPVRLVVIEASGMIGIDYTGSVRLQQSIAQLRGDGIEVAIARLSAERAQHQAERTGLLAAIGTDHVFRTVEEAVHLPLRGA